MTTQPNQNYSDLPRSKMQKLMVAYDVDGTLRCNCTETCEKANQRIVDMFNTEASFKNTNMFVWSGGGAAYALRFARLYGLNVKESHCISKFGAPKMDRVVDDIQETALGHQNYIVNEKRVNHE